MTKSDTMKESILLTGLGILCLVAVAIAGCTGIGPGNSPVSPATPHETPVQTTHLVVTEEQNTATVHVSESSIITVQLPENPTTGYQWNLTVTPGLQVTKDTYVPSDTTGTRVGSGGTRLWDLAAVAKGEQKITAVYSRSWEPRTGNETTFALTVVVG